MVKYEIETVLDTYHGPLGEWKLVKWKGYSEENNLWVREINEENEDKENEAEEDRRNYVDLDKTMKIIRQYATPGHTCNIKQYIGQGLKDNEIGCLDMHEHLYVLTRYRGEIIIADGVNNCHGNSELLEGLAKAEETKRIRCIGYQFQTQEGHCASSGILIAIEIIRIIQLGGKIP